MEKNTTWIPDSKAVCAITAEARIHTDTAKAYKAECLQAAGGSMAEGSTIFGGANTGKLQEQGFDEKYSIVKEYVRGKKMDLDEKATVRFETMPGKQGQMGWGFFEGHLVYEEGKWKKLYCFLMILEYSRMRYIEFVTDMGTNTLIRCHQNAFRYFGGYPEEILYDNMKQVVIKRLLKQEDSTLNRQFEDFAGFYGFKSILCRPYRGQTKGKVERTVQFVRDNFMAGIKYGSLSEFNGQATVEPGKPQDEEHSGDPG